MRLGIRESVVARHARALGCKREWPLVGLCVGCPFERTCKVPRAPLALWTVCLNQEMGRAMTRFYFNALAQSDISTIATPLKGLGIVTYRKMAIQMRCGDVLSQVDSLEVDGTLKPTVNLHELLNRIRPPCTKLIPMDSRQVRYNQVSNYGRKSMLAVQTCSKDCARDLTDDANRSWHEVFKFLRKVRPIREVRRAMPVAAPIPA